MVQLIPLLLIRKAGMHNVYDPLQHFLPPLAELKEVSQNSESRTTSLVLVARLPPHMVGCWVSVPQTCLLHVPCVVFPSLLLPSFFF
jgi:hypothetical protein